MTLRSRTALAIGMVLLACAVLVVATASVLLSRGIGQLAARATRDMRAVRLEAARSAALAVDGVLSGDLEDLAEQVVAWARRDDTYAYLQSRSAAWRRDVLPNSVCPELRLSVVALVSSSGRIVDRMSYDLERGTFGDLPAGLADALLPGQPLTDLGEPPAVNAGLLLLPEGPLLAAAAPILPSSRPGSPRGILVAGRFLTPGEVARIGDRALSTVELFRIQDADLPADVRAAAAGDSAPSVGAAEAGAVRGYVIVRDLGGSPALVARVSLRNDPGVTAQQILSAIESRASDARLWIAAVALGAFLLSFGTVRLVQESLLFRRTGALAARLEEISSTPEPGGRVEAKGDDELARLENAVNEALAAVEHSGRQAAERERALAAALERCRLAFQATNQLAFDVDVSSGRISLDGAVDRITGYAHEELRSVPLSAWEAMLHPEDRAATLAAGERAATEGAAYRVEYRLKRKDGTWVGVEERGRRAPGAGTRVVGTIRALGRRRPPDHGAPDADRGGLSG